jgi:hypothetical protein
VPAPAAARPPLTRLALRTAPQELPEPMDELDRLFLGGPDG